MKPENSSSGGDLTNSAPSSPSQSQDATANVLRSQINAMYGDNVVALNPGAPAPAQSQTSNQATQQPQAAQQTSQAAYDQQDINPYDRTHNTHPQPQAEQWKQYHSAWQTYYQKYYEGYYEAQKAKETQTQEKPAETYGLATGSAGYFTTRTDLVETTEELEKDQALFELRQKLLGKVKHSAKKVRGSKHFIPIVAALTVVLVFVFLQYNRVFIASVNAYVSPGAISPQNIVIDPTGDSLVGADPRLIIPKINVDVPAIYGVGNDNNSQMAAMEKGVAHFAIPGAHSRPGEIGNTVLSGHSSNDLFDGGDYKFIFAQLEKMAVGDMIYTNYEGKRYTYIVTKTQVVKPTEVNALVYPTSKPILTLITCTPLGTSLNRLLVTAEQVSPDPAAAAQAPADSSEVDEGSIPGSSPTFLEKLFGAR